jgi:hypothetical protein
VENEQSDSGTQVAQTCCGVTRATSCASDALDVAIELLEDIQKLVGGGRPKAVRVRFGEKTVCRMPIALTAAAAFAAGLAAVLLTKLVVEVEHED